MQGDMRPERGIKRTPSFLLLEMVTNLTNSPTPQRRGVPSSSFVAASSAATPPMLAAASTSAAPQVLAVAPVAPPPSFVEAGKRDANIALVRPPPVDAPPMPDAISDESMARPTRKRLDSSSLQHPSHEGDYEWLKTRLCDGEAATCLSLSGNWAVALTPQRVGETIDYTVRDKVKLPGKEKLTLVTLTEKFQYYVLGVYGDEKGRAVALQPKAKNGQHKIYIAFRGLRNRGVSPQEDAHPKLDRAAFRNTTPTHAHWLPDKVMRVHGGVLDHHASVWTAGLGQLFKSLADRLKRGFPVKEVLLIGLSMGGALAGARALPTPPAPRPHPPRRHADGACRMHACAHRQSARRTTRRSSTPRSCRACMCSPSAPSPGPTTLSPSPSTRPLGGAPCSSCSRAATVARVQPRPRGGSPSRARTGRCCAPSSRSVARPFATTRVPSTSAASRSAKTRSVLPPRRQSRRRRRPQRRLQQRAAAAWRRRRRCRQQRRQPQQHCRRGRSSSSTLSSPWRAGASRCCPTCWRARRRMAPSTRAPRRC